MRPALESVASDAAPRCRLLLIARDFPPIASSAALRAASFSRGLAEHGWATSVVTIRRTVDTTDVRHVRTLPPECRVVEAAGFDSKHAFSWRGRYPGVLAFPDREVSWIADGVRQALRVCGESRIDAILSTSPPVSAHAIAFAVKKRTSLPWMAELRDPWSLDTPLGPFLRSLDRRLERRLLRASDRVVVTTPGLGADLGRRLGTEVGDKVRVLHNGYEEEAMPLPDALLAGRFTILHTGSCLPTYRDPAPFLEAVRLCLDRGDLPAEVSVELVGTPVDPALRAAIRRSRLEGVVYLGKRLDHRDALAAVARAPLLLLLQTRREHDLCIPLKAYEYLRTERPILAITGDNSETAALLRGFDGVNIVPPTDIKGIARVLAAEYRVWAANDGRRFTRDVARYSRRRVAADLARELDRLLVAESG